MHTHATWTGCESDWIDTKEVPRIMHSLGRKVGALGSPKACWPTEALELPYLDRGPQRGI